MNQVVELPRPQASSRDVMSVTEVTQHAVLVQQVMQTFMKEGEHYGRIPGTDKPTLYKAGAEKLCVAFRIADKYKVEDLSTETKIRYRVECIGEHQISSVVLGSGLGECSSGEEKYQWRKAVCREEFEATAPHLRRVKFGRKTGGHYTVEQVRNEPDDLANTVLKMACKRAKMAMVLNVTAASDCFTQDLEDLDATLAQHLAEDERAEHMESVRKDWCDKAKAAATTDALGAVMKAGVKVFQSARDRDGYAAFAKAVQARGAALKAKEGGAQ